MPVDPGRAGDRFQDQPPKTDESMGVWLSPLLSMFRPLFLLLNVESSKDHMISQPRDENTPLAALVYGPLAAAPGGRASVVGTSHQCEPETTSPRPHGREFTFCRNGSALAWEEERKSGLLLSPTQRDEESGKACPSGNIWTSHKFTRHHSGIEEDGHETVDI